MFLSFLPHHKTCDWDISLLDLQSLTNKTAFWRRVGVGRRPDSLHWFYFFFLQKAPLTAAIFKRIRSSSGKCHSAAIEQLLEVGDLDYYVTLQTTWLYWPLLGRVLRHCFEPFSVLQSSCCRLIFLARTSSSLNGAVLVFSLPLYSWRYGIIICGGGISGRLINRAKCPWFCRRLSPAGNSNRRNDPFRGSLSYRKLLLTIPQWVGSIRWPIYQTWEPEGKIQRGDDGAAFN